MEWGERRGLIGTHLTVVLTGTVAVLSIVTGIANISAPAVGLLDDWIAIPEIVHRTAGFTGAMTGFLMLLSAYGLRTRLRVAWWSTAVLLPMTAIQGLLQSSVLSIPLILVSALAMPNLLANRARFDRELELTNTQIAAGLALVGAQAYGTLGTYALREEFGEVETILDAFYFTLVTASTVGYGDATPLTQQARLFGMSVLLVGTASFAVALGALLSPVIEARFAAALGRMNDAELASLDDHVLVLGYGELTEPILQELESRAPFVVVTEHDERADRLGERDLLVLRGDPSDEETIERAGLDRARAVVVATDTDAEDALTVLTVRQLRPDVRIVSAATDRENVPKLRRAGADAVISPATIGGRLMVQSALGRDDTEDVADRLLGDRDR
ncbi:NAD-binding protein [Halalkalicoccus jeotgali]|uniref:Kef-type transporter NAD-binding protein 2 n=1 Tax=Halalkalicoccus jeotgali (strain DSM 18796 / CECT 7217 / JCM 14584 / KCTC 4019 / B3) TaxID=795797 RepID=D8JAG3_HALJB|nr:NAD-binding protein [Halalkalicoccus jeotgali]ADJ14685.1 NAD-binding protein 2 (Kef-type transporter subunit) [Halalkalicoccus jeotgali B3]ELY39583.1 Kef-type transporter NAD-binding protein 2 [Halalkalicoccus jeotgali B3]